MMRERLRRLGYKPSQIDAMVKHDEKKKSKTTAQPTITDPGEYKQEKCLPCKSSTISSDATCDLEEQNRMLLKRALGISLGSQAHGSSVTGTPLTSINGDSYSDRVETSRRFLRNLGLHTERSAPGAPSLKNRTGFPSSRPDGAGTKEDGARTDDDKVREPYPERSTVLACDECHMRFAKLDDLRMHGQDHEMGFLFCPSQACATVEGVRFRGREQLHRHAWRQHGVTAQDVDAALAMRTSIPIDRADGLRDSVAQEL